MTKNSILKKLLAIGVGTVCVTTGALFAACDKKDDNNNGCNNPPPIGAHTHQWSTGNEAGAWGSNTTHHWRICLADGHGEQGKTDAEGYGAHVYDNEQDTSCNTCGYKRTIAPPAAETTAEWIVEEAGSLEGKNPTTYAAGDSVTDNALFTLKTVGAAEYSTGAKNNQPVYGDIALSIGTHTIDQGLIPSEDVAAGSLNGSIYTVAAKETVALKIHLNFVNASFNSDRGGNHIVYGLSTIEGVALYESSKPRANIVTLNVVVPKGSTLNLGVNNIGTNTGRLWIYGIEAEVCEKPVTVSYKYGENLLGINKVEDGATLTQPKLAVLTEGKQLKGWFTTADGDTAYKFGALTAGTTSVDVYAQIEDIPVVEGQLTSKIMLNKEQADVKAALAIENAKDPVGTLTGPVTITFTGDDVDHTQLATAVISGISNNSSTSNARIRVPGLSTIKFNLVAGYTYKITINASSSGSTAREITLSGTSYTNKVGAISSAMDCVWDDLVAGEYTATMDVKASNNMNIHYIEILAIPVQA